MAVLARRRHHYLLARLVLTRNRNRRFVLRASTRLSKAKRKESMSRTTRSLEISKTQGLFDGKVALITGGTSGIGAATVKRVSNLGANVFFTGRRVGQTKRIIQETKQNAGKVVFFPSDLGSREDVKRIVPTAVATFGRLDFAFNNAGVSGPTGLFTEQSERSFDLVFAVNVKALFLLLQDELRQMVAQGSGGSIVNTSSVNGVLATPGSAPYVASKHAVLGLTKSAAVEYGKYGIRVNAVSPGAIRTELLLNVFGSHEALDQLGSVHPLSRIGSPEEIAESVVWLFSDSSSYFTGQSLVVDGGLTAQRPGAAPLTTAHHSAA
jgi:A-factor type gamma-butyrolactone 1'-reductase (1S-forming)